MSMDRWNPFRENGAMRQAMDRWMDDRFNNSWLTPSAELNTLSVAVDVHETTTGYELEAALPGIKPENVDIQVDRETVTLRGTTVSENKVEEGRNYLFRERRGGSFFRIIRLPEAIDADKVEATLDQGILRVQLPKLTQAQNRRVQVRSAGSSNQGNFSQTAQSQSNEALSNDEIAATSGNEGGGVIIETHNGGTKPMNEQPAQNQPNDAVSDLKEGVTGYGGEKQGLDASQGDGVYQEPRYNEGGLQARGNDATPSSTSGMSDVRTHQSVGQGTGNLGGGPEGGETNEYSDQSQTPNRT